MVVPAQRPFCVSWQGESTVASSVESVTEVHLFLGQENLLATPDQKSSFIRASNLKVDYKPRVGLIAADLSEAIGGKDSFLFDRQRIDIELDSQEKQNTIRRKYPESIDDLAQLSDISFLALDKSDLNGKKLGEYAVYGYVIKLLYHIQDTYDHVLEYLTDIAINHDLADRIGVEGVVGGSATIYITEEQRVWMVRFEPYYGDKDCKTMALSLTYQIADPEETLPDCRDEVYDTLVAVWQRAEDLVSKL